jgi:hypothetical protein
MPEEGPDRVQHNAGRPQRRNTAGGRPTGDDVTEPDPPPEPKLGTLDHCHWAFTKWLGKSYDLGALDVTISVAACDQLGGDPPWLLVVSGSGAAKTETVVSLAGVGAHVTSTVASEGALLSATAKKERGRDATGGLLRKIGDHGLLVIKDFTTILAMSRDARAAVLAALREVYDGKWERNVGTDGGRTLTWIGRIVLIGAVTTAYDAAHTVIAAMGDRFALIRMDSSESVARLAAGRQALLNVNHETEMRAALSESVGALLRMVDEPRAELSSEAQDRLLEVANLVTLARTAVERDYRGEVIDAHAPEMPTRFAKMLGQIVRGGLSVGMTFEHAMHGAIRVAGDSMPPLRLAVLTDVAAHPLTNTSDCRKRLQKPRSTVDRELQALHMLGLLELEETPSIGGAGGAWMWSLTSAVDPDVLSILVARNGCMGALGHEEETTASDGEVHAQTAKTGNQDHELTTVVPLFGEPKPVCPRCRFALGSNGHAANCESDAA